jgi:hypothetical protein
VTHAHASREEYVAERQANVPQVLSWAANGQVIEMECLAGSIDYRKVIRVGDELETLYDVRGTGVRLFSEWNLSLPSDAAGTPEIGIHDGRVTVAAAGLDLEVCHNAGDFWVEQIFSASNTEGGVELAPQGWTFVFAKDMVEDQERCLRLRWRVAE